MAEQCPPGTSPDRYKCRSGWPRYPCYNPKTRFCVDKDGVVLIDPLGNIAYSAMELWERVCRAGTDCYFGRQSQPASNERKLEILERSVLPLTGKLVEGSNTFANLVRAKKAANWEKMASNVYAKAEEKGVLQKLRNAFGRGGTRRVKKLKRRQSRRRR